MLIMCKQISIIPSEKKGGGRHAGEVECNVTGYVLEPVEG